ncbi:MAG: hypothetical protein JSV97_02045 [candidate division WOR-3 bacterium]|nr:MAG: hypothetical protein JSV97_02045 [candidate division WOR-3 bacterium]
MTAEKGFNKYVWIIMMVLSIIFIIWTLFVMSRGTEILPTAFKLAGSSQLTEEIEKKALDFMNMSMLKPLWEEIWIGIFGLFIAFGLKRKMKYAWTLGIFWGIMMITNAAIQGGYEVLILGWSMVCLQTYVFLFPGIIALVSLLIARKGFSENETKSQHA